MEDMTPDTDRVELVIPASAEYVVLARLTATGIASRIGMSYDDIEDLRVIAAEVCRLLIGDDNHATGTVAIAYSVNGTSLQIEAVGHTSPPAPEPADDDLSVLLLSALAEELDVVMHNGERRVRVVKRLSS